MPIDTGKKDRYIDRQIGCINRKSSIFITSQNSLVEGKVEFCRRMTIKLV